MTIINVGTNSNPGVFQLENLYLPPGVSITFFNSNYNGTVLLRDSASPIFLDDSSYVPYFLAGFGFIFSIFLILWAFTLTRRILSVRNID
jgi:hypothetical protein